MKIQRANTVAAPHMTGPNRPMPGGAGFPSPFLGGRMLPATPGQSMGGPQVQHPAYGGNVSPNMTPKFAGAGPAYDHENPRAPREAGARYYDPEPQNALMGMVGGARHGHGLVGVGGMAVAGSSVGRHQDDHDDMYDDPFMDYQQQVQQANAAAAARDRGYVQPRFM